MINNYSYNKKLKFSQKNNYIDKTKYIPEIDGLRAIAVITVIFYHFEISFFG